MARRSPADSPLSLAYLTLRRATDHDPARLASDLASARQHVEDALIGQSTTKSDAAKQLGVSATTFETWVGQGLIPLVRDEAHKRDRVPLGPLLALVSEVEDLRTEGKQRGLLVEAITRLEANDARWREAITPLLDQAKRPFDRKQYVPAGRPDWHPED